MIIHEIEQGTDEWYELRAGIPTASMFSNLITAKTRKPSKSVEAYAYELAAEKYAGGRLDPWLGNMWTDRGHELEEFAFREYSFLRNMEVSKVGFITDDENTVGCSPDGIVGEEGLLEIKCLKAAHHVKMVAHIKENGTCPEDYFLQTQGQMYVMGRKWTDLLFYHDVLPSSVFRVEPDKEIFELLDKQLKTLAKRRDELLTILTEQKTAA